MSVHSLTKSKTRAATSHGTGSTLLQQLQSPGLIAGVLLFALLCGGIAVTSILTVFQGQFTLLFATASSTTLVAIWGGGIVTTLGVWFRGEKTLHWGGGAR